MTSYWQNKFGNVFQENETTERRKRWMKRANWTEVPESVYLRVKAKDIERDPVRSCYQKIQFITPATAVKELIKLRARGILGNRHEVYECPHCGGCHIGAVGARS